MSAAKWVVLTLACLSWSPIARAGLVADLAKDWSDTNNSNTASFGTWSYREGNSLLAETPNFTFGGTLNFPTPQPAWAPSNSLGNLLPAEFKAQSAGGMYDWQAGDVVVHTTDPANGESYAGANFLWTASSSGYVTISGDVWAAALLTGRDNNWSLLVNGSVVSTGASIDPYSRANPFDFSNGTGGAAALTQYVAAGSTIELDIDKTDGSLYGYLVGVNLTITQDSAAVPEPSSLVLTAIAGVGLFLTRSIRRIRNR